MLLCPSVKETCESPTSCRFSLVVKLHTCAWSATAQRMMPPAMYGRALRMHGTAVGDRSGLSLGLGLRLLRFVTRESRMDGWVVPCVPSMMTMVTKRASGGKIYFTRYYTVGLVLRTRCGGSKLDGRQRVLHVGETVVFGVRGFRFGFGFWNVRFSMLHRRMRFVFFRV